MERLRSIQRGLVVVIYSIPDTKPNEMLGFVEGRLSLVVFYEVLRFFIRATAASIAIGIINANRPCG
jgi:hypothetical protein